VGAAELVADGIELTLLELGYPNAAPALGGTDQSGMHQLQNRTLAEGMRNDLGAPPFLTKQPSRLVVRMTRRCAKGKRR
jgi:hypothetical protein